MSQVTLRINGFTYTLGCQDGEEAASCQAMAAEVDRQIETVKALNRFQNGEARMLVIAALLLADDLHDVRPEVGSRTGSGSK